MNTESPQNTPEALIQEARLHQILRPVHQQPLEITVEYTPLAHPDGDPAADLCRRAPRHTLEPSPESGRVLAHFDREHVQELFELFECVKDRPGTLILVNHRPLPYGQDLWLFLMWFYRVR